jgi:hypothetical protein
MNAPEPAPANPNDRFDSPANWRATYRSLRWTLFAIGAALPLVLWIGGANDFHLKLQPSISQYYHADLLYQKQMECVETAARPSELGVLARANSLKNALDEQREVKETTFAKAIYRPGAGPMRNWFVGSLFIVGILLVVYKGHSGYEDWVLNVGGLFAMGVALFPMPWGTDRSAIDEWLVRKFSLTSFDVPSFHFVCAFILFVAMGLMCLHAWCEAFRDRKEASNPALKRRLGRYIAWYRFFFCGFVATILGGVLLSHLPTQTTGSMTAWQWLATNKVFFVEWFGIWCFAGYWCTRSFEISSVHRLAKDAPEDAPQIVSPLFGPEPKSIAFTVLVGALAVGVVVIWLGRNSATITVQCDPSRAEFQAPQSLLAK